MADPSCATASQGELTGRWPMASSTLLDNRPGTDAPRFERHLALAIGDGQRLARSIE